MNRGDNSTLEEPPTQPLNGQAFSFVPADPNAPLDQTIGGNSGLCASPRAMNEGYMANQAPDMYMPGASSAPERYPYTGYYYYPAQTPSYSGAPMPQNHSSYEDNDAMRSGATSQHQAPETAGHSMGAPYSIPMYQPAMYYPAGSPMMSPYPMHGSYQMPVQHPMAAHYASDMGHYPADATYGGVDPSQEPYMAGNPPLTHSDAPASPYAAPTHPHAPAYSSYGYGAQPYYAYSRNPAQLVPQSQVMGQPMSLIPGYGATLIGRRSNYAPDTSRRRSSSTNEAFRRGGRDPRARNASILADADHSSSKSSPTRSDPLRSPAPTTASSDRAKSSDGTGRQDASASSLKGPGGIPAPIDTSFAVNDGPMSINQRQGVRSNYVMWCGNVPSDATLEELWSFFSSIEIDPLDTNTPVDARSAPLERTSSSDTARPAQSPQNEGDVQSPETPVTDNRAGILSIFIIARSSCAFVNYVTPHAMDRGCEYFQGKPLRSHAACPKLVCRPRKQEDADYAGVAAQRGKGMHVAWYRQQREAERLRHKQPEVRVENEPAFKAQTDALEKHAKSQSSGESRSFSSTNSSLLRQPAFKHRFFILKSRSHAALEEALSKCVWTTQPHNEPVLDQAFRNSATVYLIFSENFSGELFGCATMTSRVGGSMSIAPRSTSDSRRSWASGDGLMQLTAEPSSLLPSGKLDSGADASLSAKLQMTSIHGDAGPHAATDATHDSSGRASPSGEDRMSSMRSLSSVASTTPSMMAEQENEEQLATSAIIHNLRLELRSSEEEREGDENTTKHHDGSLSTSPYDTSDATPSSAGVKREDGADASSSNDDTPTLKKSGSASANDQPDSGEAPAVVTGQPFSIRWLITKSLPFSRVQHLRNPWRDNRLVKVSRDGTELEPSTGQELLKLWESADG